MQYCITSVARAENQSRRDSGDDIAVHVVAVRQTGRLRLGFRLRDVAFHGDGVFFFTGMSQVISELHSHQMLHLRPECFFNALGHFAGESHLSLAN